MKNAEQPQLRASSVLDTVNLAAREKDARAATNRRARFSGPHSAGALEDAENFFVVMEVIRSASGRNAADELRRFVAAELFVHEHAVPAIAGGLWGAIS